MEDTRNKARSRFEDEFVSNHKLIQQNSDHPGTHKFYIDEQTQLIKESKERKETPDGLTYHLWGDGDRKTSSWGAYLLGSNDEAVIAVKYYLDLKEIAKQAETKSTNNKHTLDRMSQLCKKSSTEDLTRFLGTVEGLRHDTTGEKFRRDHADRYVGNHQNTGRNNSVDIVPMEDTINTARTRFEQKFVSLGELIQQNSHNAGTQNVYIDWQTKLIKESEEMKTTPDGRTYRLWDDNVYSTTSSWSTYLLGSTDSNAVLAVKYYLDLKEITKQAETEATNNKHILTVLTPVFQAFKTNSIENPSGFLAQLQRFAFRKDTTEENFRRDHADRYVGNHQNTNSPAESKELGTEVAKKADTRTTTNNNTLRRLSQLCEKDSIETLTSFLDKLQRFGNPTDVEDFVRNNAHRRTEEQGNLCPRAKAHTESLRRDNVYSSTETLCTVIGTKNKQIANFFNSSNPPPNPKRDDYKDEDQYEEAKLDHTTYLRSKDEVARKCLWADDLENIIGDNIPVHEVIYHYQQSKRFEARHNRSIDDYKTETDKEINRRRDRLAWLEGGNNGSRNLHDYGVNRESLGMKRQWDDDDYHRDNKRRR